MKINACSMYPCSMFAVLTNVRCPESGFYHPVQVTANIHFLLWMFSGTAINLKKIALRRANFEALLTVGSDSEKII